MPVVEVVQFAPPSEDTLTPAAVPA
jgi:hypothetical protein